MQDLQYIIGIGFSGADLPRAIILAFLFAMFAKGESNLWKVGLLALLIDRTVWPIAAMGSSGAEIQSIYAAIGGMAKSFTDDLGIYIVRYIGLVLMIGGFRWMRSAIHGIPGKAAAA
ncbi:hypothetical protein PUV54_10470 [Hyphococcus flavus]|uniref:Uncharacterized protein n=1 Tax=Hyphococcus flavus TaxID=1866326 RepID=A0AAE9ZCF3_9PROT|nr:hypothetical protein [Hyphococcus flavus]WDI30382.1 hypothetical protein PUV54_10470 [Hyphococcus flavus]